MDVFSPSADAFRFYSNDAGEAASTPLANQDTNVTVNVNAGDQAIQLRWRVQNTTAVAGATTDDWTIQVSKNGGAYTSITTGTSNVKATASGLTNDAVTTDRATNGISNGTGSFVAGEQSSDGTIDDRQLTASNYTEHVFGITLIKADLTNADTLDFRLSLNGASPGMTNAVVPRATVQKAQAITIVAAQGSYTLTGQAIATSRGRTGVMGQGSYTLTGQAATLLKKKTLTAAQGAYTLTGQAAQLSSSVDSVATHILTEAGTDRLVTESGNALIAEGLSSAAMTAVGGTYTLTGQAVTLSKAGRLTAAQGSYTTTGQADNLTKARILTAVQGSYALTGQAVAFKRAYVIAIAQGAYVLSGQAAALSKDTHIPPIIQAGQGTFTLTGQAVGVEANYILAASQGSYTFTGQTLTFRPGEVLPAARGNYALAGQSMSATTRRLLSVANGIYVYTGQNVVLTPASIGGGGATNTDPTGWPAQLSIPSFSGRGSWLNA